MTKVSYVVIDPDKTRRIVKTLAEACEAAERGSTFKIVYSKISDYLS